MFAARSASVNIASHRAVSYYCGGVSEHYGVQRCIWLTLKLVTALLEADVPKRVIDSLAPAEVDPTIVEAAMGLLLGSHYADVTRALPVLGGRWLIKRRQNLSTSTWLRQALLPRLDVLRAAYPSMPGPTSLRYPIHWIDLANDGLRASLGREGRRLSSCERTRMTLAGWLEAPVTGPT